MSRHRINWGFPSNSTHSAFTESRGREAVKCVRVREIEDIRSSSLSESNKQGSYVLTGTEAASQGLLGSAPGSLCIL